jgi:hypothetical protein
MNTQWGTGIHVEPKKKASKEAMISHIPCPMLGRNSRMPARIPMTIAKGKPMIKPTIIKIVATIVLKSSCPLKNAPQI